MKILKLFKLQALLPLIFLVSSFTSVLAGTDEDLENYMTECDAPAEFYDAEAMAKTVANPEEFNRFLTELNKPATTKALLQCVFTPEQMETMLVSITDPNKMMNAMTTFMDPQVYFAWMVASMNPQTYQPISTFINPVFYMQWLEAMANTEIYQPMLDEIDS